MPKITFIEHNGTEHVIAADRDRSAMQAATDHMVPGIIADCGGNCSCATCHVYVDAAWESKIEPPSEQERAMIECALHVRANSRLSCQIPVTPALEGLVLHLPESADLTDGSLALMQAAIFKGVGQPLVIETRPDPVPESDEVVLRVGRCGVCGTDLSMTDGSGRVYESDSVIGHEFAGEVVATGTKVTGLKVGDRITALPYAGCGHCATCLAGRPNFCAQFRGVAGGFGQYLATPERVAVKLPSTLTLADGALIEPLAVSLHGVTLARMTPGARVLVIGAGPIGLGAVYWARRLGAGPIAVTARTRRAESLAAQMGANVFVIPESAQDWVPTVSAGLGGLPDVVIEAVGKKDLIAQAVSCVRPMGTVVVLGFCGVPDSFIPAIAVWKEVTMRFSMTYSIAEFEHVARVLDSGDVECRAMITDTVPLAALPESFESLRQRTHQCKLMVSPWE